MGNISQSSCYVPLFIVVVIYQCSYIRADPDLPPDFCTNKDGGLIPHPSDCSKFVICTHGRAIAQACAPSMLFDSRLKACNFEHSTTCKTGQSTRPVSGPSKTKEISYSNQRKDYVYQPIDIDSGFRRVRVDVNEDAAKESDNSNSNQVYQRPEERSGREDRFNEHYYNSNNPYQDHSYYDRDVYGYGYQEQPGRYNEQLPHDNDINYRGDKYDNNGYTENEHSPPDGYQTRPYLDEDQHSRNPHNDNDHFDGYQTRQTNPNPHDGNGYNENSYQRDINRDNDVHPDASRYGDRPGIHRSSLDPDVSESYIPGRTFISGDGLRTNDRYENRDFDRERSTQQLLRKQEEPNMFHYVHSDMPDPDVFKRVRGPGEDFQSLAGNAELHKSEAICESGDGLYDDSEDCTHYYQCANGTPYNKQCPVGTFFTASSGICGYDSSGCRDRDVNYFDIDRPRNDEIPRQLPEPRNTGSRDNNHRDRERYNNVEAEHDDMDMVAIEEFMKSSLVEAKANALKIIHQEVLAAVGMIPESRRPFRGVSAFLGSTPYVKQLSLPAFLQLECLRMIKNKFQLDKVEISLVMEDMGSALPPSSLMVGPDMFYPQPSMTSCPFPRNDEVNDCDPDAIYRTFDGSCNNLHHPLWGKSFRAVGRFLQPDYADGIGELRRAKSGHVLPSTRAVSVKIYTPSKNTESHVHTVMMMTFGQFLAHDLIRTAVTKLSKTESGTGEQVDVMCGASECETEGAENRACEPILVLRGDRDFTNKTCLMFVRTQEVMRDNCELAPREQLNQLTSWLDASMIYGSTKNESEGLRDKTRPMRGQLATIRHPYDSSYDDLLPQKENKDCRDLNSTVQCFAAGDGRVNEHIGLIALHTVFTRAHNNMEEQLHDLNPHWGGERLYQETRRIMAALWQVIIYEEYLPLVLGPEHMKRHGLVLERNGYWDGYSASTNPDVTNSFGTAAFRFGHSQIGDVIRLTSQIYKKAKELDFSTVLRRPATVYETRLPAGSAVDSIILGMVSQPAEEVDEHFSKEMTVRLFSEDPPIAPGLDLPAINTQRGRDHGIPGYNYWRDWCGLSRARTFDELVDVSYEIRLKLSELYEDVDDIDLFPAGIAERHVPGGVVGPTFACIIARQFRALRVSDRFWHERPDPTVRFTPDQLEEIRKFTLARVICDNTDRVDDIQKLVMMQPLSKAVKTLGRHNYMEAYNIASLYHGENNERHPCSHLPRPDLTKWRERTGYNGL